MANAFYKWIDRAYKWFDKKPDAKKAITLAILFGFTILGIYIRALPAINYGLELHANDPWIEYWQANYTYTHGLLSWYTLTRANPATHIFWYPWGRDFTRTSYPGLSIWTAATYYLVKPFGLTIKDWVVLQPLVFAFIAFITIYLAAKEITGSEFAGLLSVLLYAVVPAASDRNIVGFVEKEGVALGFIFLFVYFYAKLAKLLSKRNKNTPMKITYTVLAALSMAIVGWFWGGYNYVLGSFVLFLILYPLFAPKEITGEFLKYNILLYVLSLLFVSVSPAILSQLGLYPFRIHIGVVLTALLILPILFNIFHINYRKLGLRKPLLNTWRYFGILLIVIIAGLALIGAGVISIGARYAWALGLHFVKAPPLVQSVEEHQPALVASGIGGILDTWGTGFKPLGIHWLFFASPLILAIIGAFYLLYKGGADKVYLAIAFLIAFYAYMNATYFEATAAAYGLLVAGVFMGYLMEKSIPSRQEIQAWRRGRVRVGVSPEYRALAVVFLLLVFINLGFSGYNNYRQHNAMIYSIMSGGAPINARTDAWYDTLRFLRENTSSDSLVIAWWDYGYWISVGAHRATVADGATFNGTQIKILAKILTSMNDTETINLLKKLKAPFNKTYILVFDVFQFIPRGRNSYLVTPVRAGLIIGLVDIPKSRWMITIGGRNMAKYFYLYRAGRTAIISPRFDEPDKLPLIYKIMVDGILYLNYEDKNHTYYFSWYTGSLTEIDRDLKYRLQRYGLNINYEIDATQTKTLTLVDRPLANDPYIKPYKVIADPFYGIRLSGGAKLVEVICIYQVTLPGSSSS